jgi:hypothetical protein
MTVNELVSDLVSEVRLTYVSRVPAQEVLAIG